METREYQTLAERTMNFGPYNLKPFDIKILNVALGITGEAGELVDYLKKIVFHGHPVDSGKMREEIGDNFWYLFALCSLMQFDAGEIMRENIEKLRKRYPNGFSAADSLYREWTEKGGTLHFEPDKEVHRTED